jgi:putative flippase GtrA
VNRPILNTEFIRFGLVGVMNTGVDLAAFVVLYRLGGLEPLLANGIAFLLAVTNSYLLNHYWTFRKSATPLTFSAYGRFMGVNAGGLLIGTLAILLLGRIMALEFAKLIAAFLTLLWNYTTSRRFVFKAQTP